jgi:hypothetical protein
MKQWSSLRLGILVATYQGSAAWMSLISMVILVSVGWKDYQDVIISWIPWFNLAWAYVSAFIIFLIINVVQYVFIQPSLQSYVNKLEYDHKSPQKEDHKQILENQKKIMDKLGIK